jgi:hypothetical protein
MTLFHAYLRIVQERDHSANCWITEMQPDPARLVSDNAKSMLAMIAGHRP